ncbi:MAG: AmmeMemoRadiSam system radical SAM enzyme [Bacteroidales bacterium]|nr:AmmeMemoRadiSam system radical SAM enzyme [Bacteroidales bacterium]
MHQALYTEKRGEVIICSLCPHNCHVKKGMLGSCMSRYNNGQELIAANYGKVSALHFDPVEKKPLYHFFPGRIIFSIGSTGCNLHCLFCQNSEISQTSPDQFHSLHEYTPEDLVALARQRNENIGIAYTYNEPAVWFEFMLDIAVLSSEAGLKNVMVTNGFINPAPLDRLMPFMDAYSIDLKAFTEDFYRKVTKASLEPVKNTLQQIRRAGRHLEITNLVIPTLNDDDTIFEEMCRWISGELGADTVLHLSRYFPTYKMSIPGTPPSTLIRLRQLALKYLDYVFIGNITLPEGNDTLCNKCKKVVIRRNGYMTSADGLDNDGRCQNCGNFVAQVGSSHPGN